MRVRMLITAALLSLVAGLTSLPVAADAATSTTISARRMHMWDRVAACESGGRWHINTGNGYYGGLQISRGTWNAFGGRRFAATANHTSKRHQIRIAERILRGQGPGAWGYCGSRAGLHRR